MKVLAYLKTPLYRSRHAKDGGLEGNVISIRGKAEARDGGLDITINELRDERDQKVEAPFKRLFLPLGKIDYYVIEDA
ncbi:MAG TPA: hypothetical protein DIU15_01440 [Deltaproteobacteria bacterium]|nr:hypothetical protein [Deltaproteobacteria bacterium]HCP44688.1 hypothetical protein [Deltaproteobacteria bacterium]